ncbi:hypothetical protein F442_16763, partial [Phytophthora nicotianae P10297]
EYVKVGGGAGAGASKSIFLRGVVFIVSSSSGTMVADFQGKRD